MVVCRQCEGGKEEDCYECGGDGLCTQCGDGNCHVCEGFGTQECSLCDGSGEIDDD